MPAAERMDLWRAAALQNAFSGASAHDESAARAAEDNIIVRRLINETSGSNMVIHHDQIK